MATHRERELALHVGGAAQLENLRGAAPPLPLQHVAENHNVVGNKFFNPVASNRTVFIDPFGGHQRGDTNFLQPGNKAEYLPTHHRNRVVLLKYSRNRINSHPTGFVLANCIINPLNQTGKIKTPRHILAFRIRRGVKNKELVLLHHLLQIPAKTCRITQNIQGRLFKGYEDSWLVVLTNAVV